MAPPATQAGVVSQYHRPEKKKANAAEPPKSKAVTKAPVTASKAAADMSAAHADFDGAGFGLVAGATSLSLAAARLKAGRTKRPGP
jgi:hypothetical protein